MIRFFPDRPSPPMIHRYKRNLVLDVFALGDAKGRVLDLTMNESRPTRNCIMNATRKKNEVRPMAKRCEFAASFTIVNIRMPDHVSHLFERCQTPKYSASCPKKVSGLHEIPMFEAVKPTSENHPSEDGTIQRNASTK